MCCITMAGQTTLNKKQCYELGKNSFLDEDLKKNTLFLVNTTIDSKNELDEI